MSAALAASADARPAAGAYRAPRTASGAPDLQGVWTNSSMTLLQRPANAPNLLATPAEAAALEASFRALLGELVSPTADPNAPAPPVVNGQSRASWIVDPPDGRLPFTDAGRQARTAANRETFDGPEGRPLSERCLAGVGSPGGPPMLNTAFNANYQIVQTPDQVAILVEMNHDVRIVRLADRRHLPEAIRTWMGDSVGWWEGDTLVVETTNLDPRGLIVTPGGGFPYSPRMRIVERFTRTAPDQILYEFTVDDPATFKRTWSAQMPMRAAKGPIYEYACHEGNYSLPNALSGARTQERAGTP